jgi:hypothetical protein
VSAMHAKIWLLTTALLASAAGLTQVAAQQSAAEFAKTLADASEEEAYAIGLEAFVYGYPYVEMARRLHGETQRVAPDQIIAAPINNFFFFDRLARPGDGAYLKAPNNDTVYATGMLDLTSEPMVLRVPDIGNRVYVALIVAASGGIPARLSTAATGPGGVDYVFHAPGQAAAVPADARALPMPGNQVWVLMRLATDGTPADEARAVALMRQFRLTPLSQRGNLTPLSQRGSLNDAPAASVPAASLPLAEPLKPFSDLQFFAVLARMLASNPVPEQDRGLVNRWQRIGLAPGKFDAAALPAPVRRGLERAIVQGNKQVVAAQFGIAITTNGWNYSLVIGKTGADWALNAAIAMGGYGNLPEDSVYYQRNMDSTGMPLTGSKAYTITFPKGQLPPVEAFWSISPYGMASLDLIENPIKRYSIGDRTPGLKPNKDGSLTLHLSGTPPVDKAQRANWLPVGDKPFYLVMRTYFPSNDIISGKYAPPELVPLP